AEKRSDINAKFEAKERELMLEKDLLYIRKQGADVEVRSAVSRLVFAKAEVGYATTDEARQAAKVKADLAAEALESSRKKTDEERAQLAIEKAVAEIVGPADAKE